MILSHILVRVILMITGLRYWTQEYSCMVIAFTSTSPLHASHSAAKRPTMSTSLGSADSEDETLPYHLLLDESVLLYSQVARQTSFESNKEIEMLRKNELTLLVEDTVFDERGFILVDSEEENEQIMKNSKGEKEPETLDEISQALDQQILLGYEAEFTEEQLEQWVGQIDALYEKLQSQAAALPPASSLADTSTSKETETAIETTTATTTTTKEGSSLCHLCQRTRAPRSRRGGGRQGLHRCDESLETERATGAGTKTRQGTTRGRRGGREKEKGRRRYR
mmetsp:Transcript_22141/g.61620  ORF Transcript_22141/g.61620 Transcript_22141/m.61620 type:complete len:281 (+) Transcript_22141:281-1123(+)